MADEFFTLMADLDDESQLIMSNWYKKLQAEGFSGKQTPGLPFHISLASFSLDKEAEVVGEMNKLAEKFSEIPVNISHIGLFAGGSVLYAAPDMNPADLLSLRQAIGTETNDKYEWSPHATILIDEAELSGKYLFNYEVRLRNLFLTNVVQPNQIDIVQETTEDGSPQVKVTFYNIKASIQIQYLYVKYGLISDSFDDPTGSVSISTIEGRYHFTKEGKVVVSEFNVEIEDFEVDVRSDFLNWLIDLFKGLIKSKVTEKLNELGSTISDEFNAWVDGEFVVDIGHGIGFNFTNTLKPQLTQILVGGKLNEIGLKLAKVLFSKETLSFILTILKV